MASSSCNIKCPNCKQAVKYLVEHFKGAQMWTCTATNNNKNELGDDKGTDSSPPSSPPTYHFDLMDKWKIVIHADGDDWFKKIESHGNCFMSEFDNP